jgi:hypothetical protein
VKLKFIKGTNKQYSIRQDGFIIRHYSHSNKSTVFFKEKKLAIHNKQCVIYMNKKKKTVTISLLMFDNFGYKLCYRCNCKIFYRGQQICDECQKKVQSKFDVIKKENITRCYVSGQLNIKARNLTDDMYNLYKANLKIKRLLSEKTGLHFNNFQ